MTWREKVPGEYWAAGPYRIELIGEVFVATRFVIYGDASMHSQTLGWHATLLDAKCACQEHAGGGEHIE